MNKYEFNISLFGKVKLIAIANSKEEAEEMVNDLINKTNIEELQSKESNIENITIEESSVNKKIVYERKEKERDGI